LNCFFFYGTHVAYRTSHDAKKKKECGEPQKQDQQDTPILVLSYSTPIFYSYRARHATSFVPQDAERWCRFAGLRLSPTNIDPISWVDRRALVMARRTSPDPSLFQIVTPDVISTYFAQLFRNDPGLTSGK